MQMEARELTVSLFKPCFHDISSHPPTVKVQVYFFSYFKNLSFVLRPCFKLLDFFLIYQLKLTYYTISHLKSRKLVKTKECQTGTAGVFLLKNHLERAKLGLGWTTNTPAGRTYIALPL